MAYAYHVYLKTPGQIRVRVRHTFYGLTKDECKTYFAEHQSVCGSFGPAVAEGRYGDKWEEIPTSEIPELAENEADEEEEDEHEGEAA